MTQSLIGGYKFKHYLIMGIPITILMGIALVVLCPIMYGFA